MSSSAATPAVSEPPPAARDDRFPAGVPYIVGNEGAERFSFYGMRQILYIYLTSLFISFAAESTVAPDALAGAKVHATQVVHLFNAGVYLFPMIGAILADRLLGKYRVIFWVSLVYCAGHAALAFAGRSGALGNLSLAELAMYAGLILVSIGSGGIKPCVSANVGDQFTAKNAHLVTRIFQIFYFIINFGSFFASLLTPWLYQNCGAEWAFGVPGILMGIATVVFWFGRRKFVRAPPRPGGKLGLLDFLASSLLASPLLVLVAVGAAVAEEVVRAAMGDQAGAVTVALRHIAHGYWPHALVAAGGFALGAVLFIVRQQIEQDTGFFATLLYCWRRRGARRPGEDFWAPARIRFGDEAADGPPAVLRIIVVFSMVSVFWALFDQHSSTWIEQAKAMNLTLTVPTIFWNGWVIPGLLSAAIFGAVWLFLWVANRPVPRWLTLGFLGLLGAWGLAALGLQLARGATETITLLPAQIAALNPLLVMIIIPLLNVLVYRPCERRGRPLQPLHRMTAGMFLASLAFVAVAILQARIQAAGRGEVHVLWQIIPFFILTIAEVLVSVTGLEFAYTQAPRAMKSTIMGFWLLCVTLGNVLVAFLAPLETLSLAKFFWIFAGLMAAAAVIFALLAAGYKGRTYLQSG
ncbi:MAG: MFS transporter [Opitutaceae bacterium]|nr:MFS transporter [Opitutaceae bacterium]